MLLLFYHYFLVELLLVDLLVNLHLQYIVLYKELLLFSLSFFVYLLVQSDFSNLASQVLHRLWVQC